MRRRWSVWLVGVAVVAAACSGGSGGDRTGGAEAELGIAASADAFGSTPVPAARLVDFANAVVDIHGGAEGFARTWWALDRGYTVAQLTDGYAGVLGADGFVGGLDPANPPLGLLSEPPQEEAEALAMSVSVGGLAGPGSFVGDTEAQQRYVEFVGASLLEIYLRGGQHAFDLPDVPEPADLTFEQEAGMTLIAAALLGRGYTPTQVIEALVLGSFEEFGAGIEACYAIPGEEPVGVDRYVDSCGPLGEAARTPDDAGSDEPDDEPGDDLDASEPPPDDALDDDLIATYEGLFDAELLNPTLRYGGRVLRNGLTLEIVDGVAQLTTIFEVEGSPTFIGSGDRVLCVADLLQVIEFPATPVGSDTAFELLGTFSVHQGPGTGEDCDGDDDPSSFEAPVTAQVALDIGVAPDVEAAALVELLFRGERLGEPIRLARID